MPYMLLIVEPPGQRAERGLEGGQAAYQQMLDYAEQMRRAGVLRMTSALATAATRVQRRGGATGDVRLVDGPFAEAKELVGGFFLIDGVTREQALDWAAHCPAAAWATVEVRETGPCYT
jgi:hypothetical protein